MGIYEKAQRKRRLEQNSLRNGGRKMNRKHGKTGSPEYRSWSMMIQRCTNQNLPAFKNYGGRGIRVCARWMKFENFYADMGDRPSIKHSIDRIHNGRNYEPGNCRWATDSEQGRNKRNNTMLTVNGKTLCIAEWEQIVGIKRRTIQARIAKGWTIKRAITERPMTASEAGYIGGVARHA